MSRTTPATLLGLATLALVSAGCPGDPGDPGGANPDKLWLALDGSELQVRLVGVEPPPF